MRRAPCEAKDGSVICKLVQLEARQDPHRMNSEYCPKCKEEILLQELKLTYCQSDSRHLHQHQSTAALSIVYQYLVTR